MQFTDDDLASIQPPHQFVTPRPSWPSPATVQIEGGERVFRIGVTSQMRFTQQVQRRHSARPRERVAHWFPNHRQTKVRNNPSANRSDQTQINQCRRAATRSVDHPLCPAGEPGEWLQPVLWFIHVFQFSRVTVRVASCDKFYGGRSGYPRPPQAVAPETAAGQMPAGNVSNRQTQPMAAGRSATGECTTRLTRHSLISPGWQSSYAGGGGGGDWEMNNPDSAGTVAAADQASIPAVHTIVSLLTSPLAMPLES